MIEILTRDSRLLQLKCGETFARILKEATGFVNEFLPQLCQPVRRRLLLGENAQGVAYNKDDYQRGEFHD